MAQVIVMPKLGLTMERGTVINWKKRQGDTVEKGDPVAEVETDKIVNEVESPCSGTLLKILVEEGTEVEVQTALAVVGKPGEDLSALEGRPSTCGNGKVDQEELEAAGGAAVSTEGTEKSAEHSLAQPRSAPRRRITPRAKKLLAEHGLTFEDLEDLPKDRITEADIKIYLEQRGGTAVEGVKGKAESLEPLTSIQRVVVSRMIESFRHIPQFSLRFVVVMDHLLELGVQFQEQISEKVTINHLFLRATALALSRFPDVQKQFRPDGLFLPEEVNLGVAVAAGADLLLPVVHNADQKRIGDLVREVTELAERAKTRKLLPNEMTGGTFTVTNLGMYGVTSFTPIVNPGEGGILGIGAVTEVPRVRQGIVEVGKAVELTLVCDHRSINGMIAAAFCRTFKEITENEEAASW